MGQAVFGQEQEIKIPHLETCVTCSGTGAKPGSGPTTCGTCGGAGQVRRATRTPFGSFTQVAEGPQLWRHGPGDFGSLRVLWWPGCQTGAQEAADQHPCRCG